MGSLLKSKVRDESCSEDEAVLTQIVLKATNKWLASKAANLVSVRGPLGRQLVEAALTDIPCLHLLACLSTVRRLGLSTSSILEQESGLLWARKLRTQSQCLERLIESVLVREKPSRHLLAEAVLAGHVTAREAISYASS